MKNYLYPTATFAFLLFFGGCSKKEVIPATSTIVGQWKYDSNIGGGCNTLIGTTWDVKNGEATTLSVPGNDYGFYVGEKMLSGIAQTISPSSYTALGYSRNYGGAVATSNIKVAISVATDVQSMTVTYTSVCNPVELWLKVK